MIANSSKLLAAALGAGLLFSSSLRAEVKTGVTDPLEAVLDPSFQPPKPPKATEPVPAPEVVAEAKSSAKKADDDDDEDARPRDEDLFNAPSLFPMLSKKQTVGLGLGAGLGTIAEATYLQLDASVYFTNHFIVGIPFNHALSSSNPDQESGSSRKRDYDEWRDYLRLLQRFDFTGKSGSFVVGKLGNVTLGESGLMQHLNNDLLADTPRLGVEIATDPSATGWLHILISDATFLSPVVGAQVGYRPAAKSDSKVAASLRFSGQYVGDLNAPVSLTRDGGIVSVADELRPNYDDTKLHGFGGDVAFRPLQLGIFHTELFGAFNMLLDHGNGIHAGLRFGLLSKDNVDAGELTVEARSLGSNYLPHYFDSFYDVQRANYLSGNASTGALTKLQFLDTLNSDSRTLNYCANLDFHFGRALGVGMSFESGGYTESSNATLHAQLQAGDDVTIFGTYQRRNFGSEGGFFKFDSNELLVARMRVRLTDTWFLTGSASRTFIFNVGAGAGGEYRPAWNAGAMIEWLVGT
jgi:hypothetical protein